MAFPFTYKQILSSNIVNGVVKMVDSDIYSYFRQKINHQLVSDWTEAESKISFISRNSLFGVNTFILIKWKFEPKPQFEIIFDMGNFLRLLSLVAIVVGLLGRMSFQHYILISFMIILGLYLINFSILKIYAKRLINDALAYVIPDIPNSETQSEENSFFSDYSVSRNNSDIHYQIKDSNKNIEL